MERWLGIFGIFAVFMGSFTMVYFAAKSGSRGIPVAWAFAVIVFLFLLVRLAGTAHANYGFAAAAVLAASAVDHVFFTGRRAGGTLAERITAGAIAAVSAAFIALLARSIAASS